MSYKNIFSIFCLFILCSCNQNISDKDIVLKHEKKYKNSGFALIYQNDLRQKKKISKKIDNRSLLIFHKNLEKNSLVKITNPLNQKTIIAKVASNKVQFSNFYNSVISLRIANELLLDFNEPYIQLSLISKNSSFIAKKAKTFDEEKKVAEKAPVDDITIDDLVSTKNVIKKVKKTSFLYSIKIADFYYKDSAKNMIERIINETNLKKPLIKKITNTKYRVLLGPYNDIKKLENSFNEMKSLNFENLEIIKDV